MDWHLFLLFTKHFSAKPSGFLLSTLVMINYSPWNHQVPVLSKGSFFFYGFVNYFFLLHGNVSMQRIVSWSQTSHLVSFLQAAEKFEKLTGTRPPFLLSRATVVATADSIPGSFCQRTDSNNASSRA